MEMTPKMPFLRSIRKYFDMIRILNEKSRSVQYKQKTVP